MKRIRLQVALLPWVQSGSPPLSSGKSDEAPLKPWLHVCTEEISLQELADQIVQKFSKIYAGLGQLTIQHLESDYGEILDLTDVVGDVFDDRAPSGESRTSIVRVACFAPNVLQLQTSTRFDSLVPESSARPRKRPFERFSQDPLALSSVAIPTTGSWNSQRSSVTLGRAPKRQRQEPSSSLYIQESVQEGPQNKGSEGSFVQVYGSDQDHSTSAQHSFTSPATVPLHRTALQRIYHERSNTIAQTQPTSTIGNFGGKQPDSSEVQPAFPDNPSVAAGSKKKGQYRRFRQSSEGNQLHDSSAPVGEVRESGLTRQPHSNDNSDIKNGPKYEPEELRHSADKSQSDENMQILKAKAFAEQLASRQKSSVENSRIQSFLDEASEESQSSTAGRGIEHGSCTAQRGRIYEVEEKRAKSLDGKCAAEDFLAKRKIENKMSLEPLPEQTAKKWPRAPTPRFLAHTTSILSPEADLTSSRYREQELAAEHQRRPVIERLGSQNLSMEGPERKENRSLNAHSKRCDGRSSVSSLDLESSPHPDGSNASITELKLPTLSPRLSNDEPIPSVEPPLQSKGIKKCKSASSRSDAESTTDSQFNAKEGDVPRPPRLHNSETESLRSISDLLSESESVLISRMISQSPSRSPKATKQIPPMSQNSRKPDDLKASVFNEDGERTEFALAPQWPITPPSTKNADLEDAAPLQVPPKYRGPEPPVEPGYISIIGPGTILGHQKLSNDRSQVSTSSLDSGRYPRFTKINSSAEPSPLQRISASASKQGNPEQIDQTKDNEENSDSDTDGSSDSGKDKGGVAMNSIQKLATMRPKQSIQRREKGYLVV